MYVVRDKKTKEIPHINPAPLSQGLEGTDVYYLYSSKTMEIGKTDLPRLPEHFTIDSRKMIREMSLEEKVENGIIKLNPDQKVVDGRIVVMTLAEKIAAGLITLASNQKVIGSGTEARIVEKTLSEQVAEKLIELTPFQKIIGEGAAEKIVDKTLSEQAAEKLIVISPHQKIVGEGADERIVDKNTAELIADQVIKLTPLQKVVGEGEKAQIVGKTPSELVAEKLIELSGYDKIVGEGADQKIIHKTLTELVADKVIELSPYTKITGTGIHEKVVVKSLEEQVQDGLLVLRENQEIIDNQVVTYTNAEMLAKGKIDLATYKERIVAEFSDLSFRLREAIIPDYKLVNAGLGIYSAAENEEILATVQAFRQEFYNLKAQVEAAEDPATIQQLQEKFPRTVLKNQL